MADVSQNARTGTGGRAAASAEELVHALERLNIEHKLADKGAVILALSGQVDTNTFHMLATTIKGLFLQKRHKLILDCSKLLYIASAGIGVIINAMTEAQANNGNVVLLNPSPSALRTLLLFGLNEVVPVAGDKQAALSHFQ